MILFNDDTCQRIIKEMNEEMQDELNDWEQGFAESNEFTKKFSPAQKEVIRNFADKYDFKCIR